MSRATPHPAAPAGPKPVGAETLSRLRLHGLLHGLLDEGLAVEIGVTGASMSPFIRTGDLVTLSPRKGRKIRRGDVVAFVVHGKWLVIHRVADLDGETVRTRGDGLRRSDDGVPAADVLAVVTGVRRNGRCLRLGLGPERALISWLSDRGWLVPLLAPVRRLALLLRNRKT